MSGQGLGGGIIISLYPLVIVDHMGLKNLPATFGVASLFVACGSLIIGPGLGMQFTIINVFVIKQTDLFNTDSYFNSNFKMS